MERAYLESTIQCYKGLKRQGERVLAQLTNEQLHWRYNEESNSIAIIAKHLHGNMLSRWTDFLTTDGEKEWRDRDREFEGDYSSKEALLEAWEEGWKVCFDALNTVNKDNLFQIVYIREEPQSVLDAIQRQLVHYSTHIGQIIYIGKMVKNKEWQCLSIPRGKSREFNEQMKKK
ncbi:DUF1572 family protein [Priestia taiwanensis]|uniref:DUF1572 domain-containing protein n=1 Tax=Priestia taiwanensis TaxID=1347902 RepID=A0A917AQN4_9BACI|nr:DUF1572 family protein [Priestia taiwanensis]MBM7363031.1 hypothetical protein [Priestia taiwanensis]GGE67039.1 hypothetical protein GCM10007140_16520 [Priestia taiwanensis]